MLIADAAIPADAAIGAYIIAFLSLLGTIHSKWDSRRAKYQADEVALRSAEIERQRDSDKLEHDAELLKLQLKNESLTDSWKRTHEELASCRKDHQESTLKHASSEADRMELRRKVEKLEAFLAAQGERENRFQDKPM